MSPVERIRSHSWLSNIIIGALFGALLTGAFGVIAFGRNLPTADEVTLMIQDQSPYMRERSGIEARLKNIEGVLLEIKIELREQRKGD